MSSSSLHQAKRQRTTPPPAQQQQQQQQQPSTAPPTPSSAPEDGVVDIMSTDEDSPALGTGDCSLYRSRYMQLLACMLHLDTLQRAVLRIADSAFHAIGSHSQHVQGLKRSTCELQMSSN